MALVFTDENGRVVLTHFKPELLSEERRFQGIEVADEVVKNVPTIESDEKLTTRVVKGSVVHEVSKKEKADYTDTERIAALEKEVESLKRSPNTRG